MGTAKQVILQGVTVLVQRVRDSVQAVQVHRLEIKVDQLTQRRALLQPRVGGQFTARMGHPANDVANCGGDLGAIEAKFTELVFKAAQSHGGQRRVLNTDTARAHQLNRLDVDFVEPLTVFGQFCLGHRRIANGLCLARYELRGIALRHGLNSLRHG